MIRQAMTGLVRGASAGLLGGAAVGICEAVALVWSMGSSADRWALPYSSVLYGLIGAGMGAGAGLLLGAIAGMRGKEGDAPRQYALSLLAPFAPLGLVILLWTLKRDVYAEQWPPKPVMAGAAVGWAVLSAALYLVLTSATRKTFLSFLLRPHGSVAAWAGMILLAWLGTFGGKGTGSGDEPPRGSVPEELKGNPNIVYIMVDTLRSDAIGAYGNPKGLTPNIDALARDAVVYEQAIAQASWTRASTASQLTSMFPRSHTAFRKADALPPDVETLPEVLLARGYYTGALVNNTNVTAQFGFDQGVKSFRYLEPEPPFGGTGSAYFLSMYSVVRKLYERVSTEKRVERVYWDAERVTQAANEWIDRYGSDRFFLFVHYMDPHDPYFRHPYDGYAYGRAEHERPDPAMAQELQELYEGEVRFMDQHIAGLFEHLKKKGLYDDTVIVLTADHGEEFYEHGGFWHGTTLYDEQIHVPLIVKYPRQEGAGTRRSEVVRHIDVAPTLVQLAGAQPHEKWQGVSLLADWNLRPERDRKAYAENDFEGNQLEALRDGRYKLIVANPGNPRGLAERELYDIASDPREQKNLCVGAAEPLASVKAAFETELRAAKDFASGTAVEAAGASMDAATCEKLKMLGYISADEDCSQYGTGAAVKSN